MLAVLVDTITTATPECIGMGVHEIDQEAEKEAKGAPRSRRHRTPMPSSEIANNQPKIATSTAIVRFFPFRNYHRYFHWSSFQLILLASALSATRLAWLEWVSREFMDCAWCISPSALPHELRFLLALFALHLVANTVSQKWGCLLIRLILLALLFLSAFDLMVMLGFWRRLTLHDFLEYANEIDAALSLWKVLAQSQIWSVILLIGLFALGVVLFRYLCTARGRELSHRSIIFLLLAIMGCSAIQTPQYHEHWIKSSVEVFFEPQGDQTAYSSDFSRQIPLRAVDTLDCTEGQQAHLNVILLIVESLSAFHSKVYSDLNDWTPELDKLGASGVRFANFLSNGVTTEQGLIALLTGEPPIRRQGQTSKTLFPGFSQPEKGLPYMLRSLGYKTAFFTTANLSFLAQDQWLRQLEFDQIEGHDSHHYDGAPRYNFDAPEDRVLYKRALHFIDQQISPYFMTLETMSSHLPYLDPSTGTRNTQSVIKYTDKAAAEFIRALQHRNYFDNGILLLTGDHRAMVPMGQGEKRRFGDSAYVRVPMWVWGKGLKPGNVVTDAFSHSDVLTSIEQMLARGNRCKSSEQGWMFSTPPKPPNCVYTRQPDNNSQIFAFCKENHFTIELAGDRTHIVSGSQNNELLYTLHRLRNNQGY